MNSKDKTTIFITGGTGFIGRHLIETLEKRGYNIRCLARTSGRAAFCRERGLDAFIGDILDSETLRGSMDGIDKVVHLVGIIEDRGDISFERVHVQGTRNMVEEAKRSGVRHFFYQSALGASLNSSSRYQRTKAEAEEIVKKSGIPCTIFRPSLIIGEKDGFTEKLMELVRLGPVVAVPGDGNAKSQPMDVNDWVKCFMTVINHPEAAETTYEFGGPEHLTYNEIVTQLMEVMGIKKPLIHMPMSFVRAGVPFVGIAQGLGKFLRKKIPSVTSEQLKLLSLDNICDVTSVEKLFGFKPITYRESLRKFV
ncbi:MAG: complex I NDUFA9 subunit family protein [Nitrospirae bacterium]|nr:complex I NDUFA9 subunit family protein [Nitrospirota bacterium]MCL5421557.1 complex I NDUFA9 subunit family protein [Nitrospirota bacterium]